MLIVFKSPVNESEETINGNAIYNVYDTDSKHVCSTSGWSLLKTIRSVKDVNKIYKNILSDCTFLNSKKEFEY